MAKFWYILPWKAPAPDDTLILGHHYRTINGFLFSAKKKENRARIRDQKQVIFSVFPLSSLCQNADDSLLCSAHRVFSTLNLFNILNSDGDLVFLLGELVLEFVRMGEDLLGKPNVKNDALLWAMPVFLLFWGRGSPSISPIFHLRSTPPFPPLFLEGYLSNLSNMPCFNC